MNKLTLKQKRFVNSYLRTGNGRLAAQEAGYSGNSHTLEQIASENLRKPEVMSAIAAAFQPEEDLAKRVISEIKLLAFAATDEPMSQANKIRSLELLAKVLQMFKESADVHVQVTVPNQLEDIRKMTTEELVAELERLEAKKEQAEQPYTSQDVPDGSAPEGSVNG